MTKISDILSSLFELKLKTEVWALAAASGAGIGALVGALDERIEAWVWSPSATWWVLVAVLVLDFVTGAKIAWQRGAFRIKKTWLTGYKLVGQTLFIAFAHHLGKHDPSFQYLPSIVIFPLIGFQLLSLGKNMAILGWIPMEFVKQLYKKIDPEKTLKKDEQSDKEHI